MQRAAVGGLRLRDCTGGLTLIGMLAIVLWLASGCATWTLLEYAIHGWLGHRFQTFVSPMHQVHHRDPHAVFTAGAWVPVGVVLLGGFAFFGPHPAILFLIGLSAGFTAYEVLHYRIHFRRARNRWETRLRLRHLAHHERAPQQIFGVTTEMWDLVFGTEPARARMRELEQAAAEVPALAGSSNWRRALTCGLARR
jgi:dihydroceramide fatty acyl 2-hydroxylase